MKKIKLKHNLKDEDPFETT